MRRFPPHEYMATMSKAADRRLCRLCDAPLPHAVVRNVKRDKICYKCEHLRKVAYRSKNPKAYLTRLFTALRSSRTKQGKYPFEVTREYVLSLWETQQGRCAITGVELTYDSADKDKKNSNMSIDRIDPVVGYVEGNVQLAAYRVNSMKSDMTEAQLARWVELIYRNICDD